jgi:TM2 domain-containing membrane protein YozV
MTTSATRITVRHNDENFGPYSLEQVNSLLVSGRIDCDDLAWVEGTAEWTDLDTIPGVISLPPPPPRSRDRFSDPNASDKLILPAFLLAFFLGMFGAHRFYVGRTSSAIAMLILTFTVVGALITFVWHLIDWIMILIGSFEDEDGKLLKQWT